MKRYKAAQIVTLLRQIEMEIAKTAPQVCKEAGITVQTYYRWRKEFCGWKHALEASAKLSVDEFFVSGPALRYGSVITKQVDKEGAPQRFGDALVHEERSFLGEHAASRV